MLNKQQQHNRTQGIGGSDGAVIAGLSKRKQPLQLFLEKTGQLPPEDLDSKEPIRFGHLLEEVIAAEAAERLNCQPRRINATLYHPDLPYVLGHIDRDLMGTPFLLECKNVGFKSHEWGAEGTDEVPPEYLIQSQHYLALKPKKHAMKLAALFSGNHLRIYDIPRDEGLIAHLLELYRIFWETHVQKGIPPEWDIQHPTTDKLLAQLYPGTNGEIKFFPDELWTWHSTAQAAAEEERRYRQTKETALHHIQKFLGEAAKGIFPDGSGYTRKRVKRKGFTVEEAHYIDFRYKKKLGDPLP